MKLTRTLFGIFLICQLFCTGCWCSRYRCNGSYTRSRPAPGCNECSNYSPEMFGTPVHGNAMLQAPGQHVDEKLNNPAKQTPYEGPSKK